MQIIYNALKKLYPLASCKKIRREGDIIITLNDDLEINYLNETSAFFLENSIGKNTIESIVQSMLTIYDVDRAILENDIVSLLRDLQWKKLIRLSKTPK